MRPDAINPADVIGGKYRVGAVLGRTRGFLVEALHAELDQRVVIRLLSPALLDEKEVALFRREARLLAKLQSEHAARILDVGTLPDGTGAARPSCWTRCAARSPQQHRREPACLPRRGRAERSSKPFAACHTTHTWPPAHTVKRRARRYLVWWTSC
jgi:serine/threonine protein kinase